MRLAMLASTGFLVLATSAANASKPEIERPTGTPQGAGVTHMVRAIPEACAWLQGTFTGDAKAPYRFVPVRSSATCQARARLVDPSKAKPSEANGWKLNDVIRIPSKDCPALLAVVEVWRKSVDAQPPKLDAQGRSRIYLQEAKNGPRTTDVTLYSARVSTEGKACG